MRLEFIFGSILAQVHKGLCLTTWLHVTMAALLLGLDFEIASHGFGLISDFGRPLLLSLDGLWLDKEVVYLNVVGGVPVCVWLWSQVVAEGSGALLMLHLLVVDISHVDFEAGLGQVGNHGPNLGWFQ